jgi:hypothetical protein
MIFAEAFWIATKSRKREDWKKVSQIWHQRRKKWPLVIWTIYRGFVSAKRKAAAIIKR